MKIVEVLGMPPQQMLARAPKTSNFFGQLSDGTYVIKEGKKVSPICDTHMGFHLGRPYSLLYLNCAQWKYIIIIIIIIKLSFITH